MPRHAVRSHSFLRVLVDAASGENVGERVSTAVARSLRTLRAAGHFLICTLAGVLALQVALGSALAAETDTSVLAVAGNGGLAKQLRLTRDSQDKLSGTATLLLRNTGKNRVVLSAKYFPDATGTAQPLSPASVPLAMSGARRLPAGGTAAMTLRAQLAEPRQPSDLDGIVLVRAIPVGGSATAPTGSVEIRVAGVLGGPSGMAFEPDSVALQVTRNVWLHETSGDKTVVRLRGPGVAKLFAASTGSALTATAPAPGSGGKSAKPKPAATLLLNNESGQETTVELRDLKKLGPDLAQVTLSTAEAPKPGSYTGTLQLAPGVEGGPTLDVKVRSQTWFVLAFIVLFFGSALGGLLPRLSGNARTKSLLRDTLRGALSKYDETRRTHATSAAWDLDKALGDKDTWFNKHWVGRPDCVAALWTNINSARSDQDLSDDTDAVVDVRQRIDRWLLVEPAARALAQLARHRVDDHIDRHWHATQTVKDTRWVLQTVKHEPETDDAADELAALVEQQSELHARVVAVWQTQAWHEALALSDHDKHTLALHLGHNKWTDVVKEMELEKLDKALVAKPIEERKSGDYAALEVTLEEIEEPIAELKTALRTLFDMAPPSQPLLEEAPELPGEPAREAEKVHVTSPDPTTSGTGVVMTAPQVASKVSGNGQGVMPSRTAPSVTSQPTSHEATSGRYAGARATLTRVKLWPTIEGALAVGTAVATAVAYMLPLYTGTWGTWQDWATAFTAGFLGQAAIKWVALPWFQSLRLRRSAAKSG